MSGRRPAFHAANRHRADRHALGAGGFWRDRCSASRNRRSARISSSSSSLRKRAQASPPARLEQYFARCVSSVSAWNRSTALRKASSRSILVVKSARGSRASARGRRRRPAAPASRGGVSVVATAWFHAPLLPPSRGIGAVSARRLFPLDRIPDGDREIGSRRARSIARTPGRRVTLISVRWPSITSIPTKIRPIFFNSGPSFANLAFARRQLGLRRRPPRTMLGRYRWRPAPG